MFEIMSLKKFPQISNIIINDNLSSEFEDY